MGTGLEATAAAQTDWYVYAPDPAAWAPSNGARLLGPAPEGDWQFSARVTVDFNGTYDAGTLLLVVDEDHWGAPFRHPGYRPSSRSARGACSCPAE
ncbi:DUF1349 domain-containing protein [Streptomyces sp. ISL-90]|nr:DUF1349 domain-containing protein [Streptomyces sp. ISL-90]